MTPIPGNIESIIKKITPAQIKKRGFIFNNLPPSPMTGDTILAHLVYSGNRKTGYSWQLWVMLADIHPTQAMKYRLDKAVCGNCCHRPRTDVPNTPSEYMHGNDYLRSCYVLPPAIGGAYRGEYKRLKPDPHLLSKTLHNDLVRLTAYGDPAMLPFPLVYMLARKGKMHTAYTHQWREPWYDKRFDRICMRSVELWADAVRCVNENTRYFRIDLENLGVMPGELECPATTAKGIAAGIQCNNCGKCDGTDGRSKKNIVVRPHGTAGIKMLKLLRVLA